MGRTLIREDAAIRGTKSLSASPSPYNLRLCLLNMNNYFELISPVTMPSDDLLPLRHFFINDAKLSTIMENPRRNIVPVTL